MVPLFLAVSSDESSMNKARTESEDPACIKILNFPGDNVETVGFSFNGDLGYSEDWLETTLEPGVVPVKLV